MKAEAEQISSNTTPEGLLMTSLLTPAQHHNHGNLTLTLDVGNPTSIGAAHKHSVTLKSDSYIGNERSTEQTVLVNDCFKLQYP